MKLSTLAFVAAIGTAASGCGGESQPIGDTGGAVVDSPSAAGAAAPGETGAATELVDRALVDSCAGFNVEKAASLLGVSAAELEIMETFSERIDSQICRYWSAESTVGPGVDFMLNVQESSDAARRILATQRELVPRVDEVPPTGPALLEFDFGDEAFWDTNTGGVVVRVRNVIATVQVSPSTEPMSHRDAGQIALERQIAEEIASVLEP